MFEIHKKTTIKNEKTYVNYSLIYRTCQDYTILLLPYAKDDSKRFVMNDKLITELLASKGLPLIDDDIKK